MLQRESLPRAFPFVQGAQSRLHSAADCVGGAQKTLRTRPRVSPAVISSTCFLMSRLVTVAPCSSFSWFQVLDGSHITDISITPHMYLELSSACSGYQLTLIHQNRSWWMQIICEGHVVPLPCRSTHLHPPAVGLELHRVCCGETGQKPEDETFETMPGFNVLENK